MNVFVTGAASGLGKALMDQAPDTTHRKVGLDRKWPSQTHDMLQVEADLSSIDGLEALMPTIVSQGSYDVVVHNAAISATGPFENIPAEAHQRLLDVNLTAPSLLTQHLLQADAIKEGGTIVFIASLSVQVGYPGAASYAASKAALANYAKSMRKTLKARNINVLTVFPGPMKTDQADRHAPKGAKAEQRMDADTVANMIWQAINARKANLIPGAPNKAFATAGRLAPGLLTKTMKKIIYDKLDRAVY